MVGLLPVFGVAGKTVFIGINALLFHQSGGAQIHSHWPLFAALKSLALASWGSKNTVSYLLHAGESGASPGGVATKCNFINFYLYSSFLLMVRIGIIPLFICFSVGSSFSQDLQHC